MGKLEQFQQDKKFGYKDESGDVILPAEYDYVPWVWNLNNNGIVIKNRKAGLVNREGSLIVDCLYDDIIPLSATLYAARLNDLDSWTFCIFTIEGEKVVDFGNYKFVERRGDYVVCYKECYSKESYRTGELYDYKHMTESEWLDFDGHIVYSGKAEDCINDCIIIKEDELYGFVNRSGSIVKSHIFSEIKNGVHGQLCVKQDGTDGEFWNVITIDGDLVISNPFSYISNEGNFYKCIKDNQYKSPIWINAKGKEVFAGSAKVLADTHLAISNGDQWGVVNTEGKKVLNFSYDSISNIKDAIIILKNNKIGLVGWNGELIIEPSYNCIEFVNMHDEVYTDVFRDSCYKQYGKYRPDFIFDTDENNINEYGKLLRSQIYVKEGKICTSNINHIILRNPIILKNDDYQELFTLDEGTLSSSRYEEIKQLTNLSFVVKTEGKYGVYRCDTKEMIVDCDYNRIQFMGNHTVLLEKNGLWGALSLILSNHLFYNIFNVDIPCKYQGIKSIDISETLFSVEIEYNDYKGEKHTKYSIVTRSNKDLIENSPIKSDLPLFESHFVEVGNQKYMTMFNDKYGFVHQLGYVCLPFKYDEILKRGDGTFDVCIDGAWGVINIEGIEIVAVKYSEKLPTSYALAEVTDARSGCKGILGADGKEMLPTIYSSIIPLDQEPISFGQGSNKPADFYAVGFGGYQYDYSSNFFCNDIQNAIWGVVNRNNETIVKPKYDCIKIIDGHFLCGRDGSFLYEESSDGHHEYANEYDGEYDVIDFNGNFIFGGCSGFHFDDQLQLYFLKFGGQWKNECTYEDDWNNIRCYSWVYHEANSRWLVLDKDLNSIIPKKDGSTYKFPSCFSGKITTKKNDKGQVTHYWNMPLELFSIEYPKITDGIMFYGEEGKRRAIRLKDRFISGEYFALEYIDDSTYYYQCKIENDFYVGIGCYLPADKQNNTSLVSQEHNNILITKPVNGFCFVVAQNDNNICDVYLSNIKESCQNQTKAISSIGRNDIFDAIAKGKLLMTLDDGCETIKDIKVFDKTIFDESFASEISIMSPDKIQAKVQSYWYSVYHVESKEESSYQSSDYIEDEPYTREDSMMDALDGEPDAYWNID